MTLADVEPWAPAIHKALARMHAPANQPLILECIREDGARAVFSFGPETASPAEGGVGIVKKRKVLERVS